MDKTRKKPSKIKKGFTIPPAGQHSEGIKDAGSKSEVPTHCETPRKKTKSPRKEEKRLFKSSKGSTSKIEISAPVLCSPRSALMTAVEINLIGEGGGSFCRVYRCRTNEGFLCAEKRLNREMSTETEEKAFMKEIEIMKMIPKHPNLIGYLGHEINSAEIKLYMNLCDSNLKDLIKQIQINKSVDSKGCSCCSSPGKHVLSNDVIMDLAYKIALGVKSLHENGIIHRDIKSENVFLTYRSYCNGQISPGRALDTQRLLECFGFEISEVMVGDFDVSLVYCHEDICKDAISTVGTPGFMPAEVLNAYKDPHYVYNEKVDVFAFGMVLYEMITLKTPFFDATSSFEINAKVLEGHRPFVSEKTKLAYPDVFRLFEMCTNYEAKNRPNFTNITSYLEIHKQFIERNRLVEEEDMDKKKLKKSHRQQDLLIGELKEVIQAFNDISNYEELCEQELRSLHTKKGKNEQKETSHFEDKWATKRSRSISPPPFPETHLS